MISRNREFINDNERAISKWHAVICQSLVNIGLLIGSIWSVTQAHGSENISFIDLFSLVKI